MIIDKNGKLFGKISIIDIAIIVLILVLIAGTYVRFQGSGKASAGASVSANLIPVTFKIEIKGVREFSFNELKEGDIVSDPENEIVLGEIVSIEINPFIEKVLRTNGEFSTAPHPDRRTVVIEVKGNAKQKKDGYYIERTCINASEVQKLYNTGKLQFVGNIIEFTPEI